ncbi:aryl-alcohol-oxidase from pleurotus Eryingii [Mycena sp. CBHHK59/15]|nr:aryl-alcohol-oxidase from pleurotus Eryingii [Mycena sp. CBHHK59/15]
MLWIGFLSFLALRSVLCGGVIIEDVADLTKLNLQFDFIVVGGGTAGNVIANRLSEDKDYSVLVLEAGGSIAYPRGFVLGGSSSVNYMVYTRGSKEDFDRFARAAADERWSWDSLIPYMRKNERFSPPADHHDTTGQFNPAVHGFDGINTTTKELSEFPFNLDMNSGYQLGIGKLGTSTIKNGSRSSSATSYLSPQYINRPNLHVLLHSRVTRVLQSGAGAFRTVEFVQDLKGKPTTITAKKEVILSAGSIGTPNILLHSGIGNSSTLSSLGIKPLHNLPSVGQNLSDHSLLVMAWLVNSTNTFETAARNASLAAEQFTEWNTTRLGPLVDNPLTHMGWLRIPDNSSIFNHFPDPAAGPNTSHFELIISPGIIGPTPPTGNYLGVTTAVVSPASRGAVTLNSSNPLSVPLINPNLLGSEVDMFIMRESVKSALRFAAAPAWNDFVISTFSVNSSMTDAQLDQFIRSNTGTVFHPVGTASMSPKGASWGVVDPDLSVKGLTGLRIADLSVLPFIPAAHTQASAYIIGERGADLIKEAWD